VARAEFISLTTFVMADEEKERERQRAELERLKRVQEQEDPRKTEKPEWIRRSNDPKSE
jgi:hypothetical protein